jgi:hypothetical protein
VKRFAALAVAFAAYGCDAPVTSVGEYRERTAPPAPDASTDATTPMDAGPHGVFVEAEDGVLTGFTRVDDPSRSGGVSVLAPAGENSPNQPGSARALYHVDLPASGTYVVWGRIHSPDASHNTVWIQLDGGSWYVWRLSTGEDWFWGTFHDNTNYGTPLHFSLEAGPHDLAVASAADEVGLDAFYFTRGSEVPAGNDTPCRPPNSIRVQGVCVPSCGSQGGNQCGLQACEGHTILPAYDCDVCCIQ